MQRRCPLLPARHTRTVTSTVSMHCPECPAAALPCIVAASFLLAIGSPDKGFGSMTEAIGCHSSLVNGKDGEALRGLRVRGHF